MKTYKILGFSSLLIIFFMACASETVIPETGSLNIKVTIGPLCPVEPCNKDVKEMTQIYESYSVVVSESVSKKVILEKKLTYNGSKGIMQASELTIGEYQLNIKPETLFTKRSFPQTFKIEKDKVTSLDIDIDTGIR